MKKIIHILLLLVSILVIITGYGITQYRIIEKITLGFLTKSLAFSLHGTLSIVFIVLLFLHIVLVLNKKR